MGCLRQHGECCARLSLFTKLQRGSAIFGEPRENLWIYPVSGLGFQCKIVGILQMWSPQRLAPLFLGSEAHNQGARVVCSLLRLHTNSAASILPS